MSFCVELEQGLVLRDHNMVRGREGGGRKGGNERGRDGGREGGRERAKKMIHTHTYEGNKGRYGKGKKS